MKRLIALATLLICMCMPAAAFAASTTNPLSGACHASAAAGSSTVCSGNQDPIVGSGGVLEKVTLIIATIAGVAAVIIIIVAGLQYITSSGDAQKAASARSAIIGAVVGLVIIAGAESIITFVISKL